MMPGTYSTWIPYGSSMESIWKMYGIHLEKVWNPSPIPWNPSTKSMESIHHSMESIPHSMESTPHSMDSTWNNPGRVKYCHWWVITTPNAGHVPTSGYHFLSYNLGLSLQAHIYNASVFVKGISIQ